MDRLTQTHDTNCLQTCIAMILGVPADALPAQHVYEDPKDRTLWGKVLRVYLDKHHGLTYVETTELPSGIDHHVLIGECSRTTSENYVWHAIVGKRGEPLWDVSPTRAGLTKVTGYGLLVPTPAEWRSTWAGTECVCAECTSQMKEVA